MQRKKKPTESGPKPFNPADNLPGPGPGRPKGIPNKITTDVRQMVLTALEGAGGAAYLQRQADENPSAFMSLVAKTMPTKVIGDPDNPVGMVITHRVELDFEAIRAKREKK